MESLGKFWKVWESFGKFGKVLESMGKFWKVWESFGKLSKLIMQFSRTWKVLETYTWGFTIYSRISKFIHVSNLCQLFLISSCLAVIIVINFSNNPRFFHVRHSRQVRTGFGEFWKAMEIDDAIFQDLESFGKREVFQTGCGKLNHLEIDIT